MTINKIGQTEVYIGNSNDARDIDHLRKLGIRSVVNVAKDLEGPWFHGDHRCYKIPLLDGPGNEVYRYTLALQVVMTLLRAEEKVLLHCQAGQSRSPAVACGVLVLLDQASTLEAALAIVHGCREEVNVAPAHWDTLRQAVEAVRGS
jgi:protein tyrosine phosphatase (PTP) superfamily phosphohydrolase (DUF442 family)